MLKQAIQRGRSSFLLALKRVAWSILECARRTSTFLSCAFREQEDDQATLPILFQRSLWQGVEKQFLSPRARRLFKKIVQQGRRRSKNRRRTLWGTLRILASRERRWRAFSTAC